MLGTGTAPLLLATLACLGLLQPGLACENSALCPIEIRLKQRVRSADVSANIAELKSYPQELDGINPLDTDGPLKGIHLFIKAAADVGSSKCDREAYDTLDALSKILNDAQTQLTSGSLMRMVEIFRRLMVGNVAECEQVHGRKVLEAVGLVSADAQDRVHNFIDKFICSYFGIDPDEPQTTPLSVSDACDLYFDEKTLLDPTGTRAVRGAVEESAGQEAFGLMREKGMEAIEVANDLLETHLLLPCKVYVEHTGEAVELATIDVVAKLPQFNGDRARYLQALLATKFCKIALLERQELADALALELQ